MRRAKEILGRISEARRAFDEVLEAVRSALLWGGMFDEASRASAPRPANVVSLRPGVQRARRRVCRCDGAR